MSAKITIFVIYEIAILIWEANSSSWALNLIHSHILKKVTPEILLCVSYIDFSLYWIISTSIQGGRRKCLSLSVLFLSFLNPFPPYISLLKLFLSETHEIHILKPVVYSQSIFFLNVCHHWSFLFPLKFFTCLTGYYSFLVLFLPGLLLFLSSLLVPLYLSDL